MKIVWLSANLFGYCLLKDAVDNNINIDSIITLSDKSKIVMYDKIAYNKWLKFGIPVYEIENINSSIKLLEEIAPDIIIVCGWRQIIDEDVLGLPPYGVVSFHWSYLPAGRGPSPIINALLADLRESGVTMFYMSKFLDAGDIIGQEKVTINKKDHASDLYNKLIVAGKKLIRKHLPLLLKDSVSSFKQDESKISYFHKRNFKDNEINLDDDIDIIYNKIRAFSAPYRGAFIKKDGKKLIIWRAELEVDNDNSP